MNLNPGSGPGKRTRIPNGISDQNRPSTNKGVFMHRNYLKAVTAVLALLVLSACAGKSHSPAYLNVAELKTNLEKRVKRVLADSDKQPPEIRINRTVPAQVSIAGSTVHLFAVHISFLEQKEKR